MVKCSIYQCKECKTVFPAKWYVGGYDGPFVIERWYDEHNMDRQKCPECKSKNLSYLGKNHIRRKQMKKLVTNFGTDDANRLFWFPPKPNKL